MNEKRETGVRVEVISPAPGSLSFVVEPPLARWLWSGSTDEERRGYQVRLQSRIYDHLKGLIGERFGQNLMQSLSESVSRLVRDEVLSGRLRVPEGWRL